jgi:chromosome segregation ATPase
MKQVLTRDEVARAIKDLESQGKKVTCTSLHAALGNRGSMSTLLRLKAEIEGTPAPVTDSPAALKLFREVWASAVAEGRQQQDALVSQLREELTAVAVENERLEGLALESVKRREDAEAERDRSVEEHRLAQADLVKAASQAQQVLEKLADERATHATEMAALRQQLAEAVQKTHELELRLVRFEGLTTKAEAGLERNTKPAGNR